MCRQWLHDGKCNSWPRSAQGADVFGDQFIEVERASETASARRPRSRDRATAGDHIALLGFGRRRRVEVRAEGRVKAETASIGAAVTVTQKSRRCGLCRQPTVLIERSPPSPHVTFLTEAYALMDYSPRTACVASRRRQIAGSAMVPAAELRGQHNEAFVGSLGVRDVPSRDAPSSMQRIRAGIE